ncbi:MAG: T9SS type A sorting domain-containing protein [Ignavibacteriaceae bacterium]|nr:T9SS type A sorting domain-containing protein [Ignavibacteriaceae bacterium]
MVNFANSTAPKLNSIGFLNYSFDVTEDTVTYHNKPVMSYSSNGVHTTYGSFGDPYTACQNFAFAPDYIQQQLNFSYAPGAIFNTAESYNAHLLGSISRRPGAEMGQVVEFFLKGGTVGVGHAYEPITYTIVYDPILFSSYQVGYSFIDAVYMAMPNLAWQNVVVGDPLTTIAWGKQTLTANLTLSDTNLVTGKITIPSGKTLTIDSTAVVSFKHSGSIEVNGTLVIQPGAKLRFYNGNSFVVNNVLTANGTAARKIIFDFILPNATSHNGLVVNNAANVSLSYAVIQNADRGIFLNSSEQTITYCEFYNNNAGIFAYNSNYWITEYTGTKIHNSYFEGNTYGMYLNESSPLITTNTFAGNQYGIYCTNESNVYLGEYLEPGVNTFTDNEHAFYAEGSFPTLGIYFDEYDYACGYNWFNSTVTSNVYSTEKSEVFAELNWWGSDPPNEDYFITEDGGSIQWSHWLESGNKPVKKNGGNSVFSIFYDSDWETGKKLRFARLSVMKGDKLMASRVVRDILKDNPTLNNAFSSLATLSMLDYSRVDKDSVKNLLNLAIQGSINSNTQALSKLFLAKIERENFNAKLDNILLSHPDIDIIDLILFKKFSYYLFGNNTSGAGDVLTLLENSFPNSSLTVQARRLFGVESNPQKPVTGSAYNSSTIILSNYPNPFNPVTKIAYSLPAVSRVRLTIYDILGKEIAVLVNEEKEAGEYEVLFDGSNAASGIYFYHLST